MQHELGRNVISIDPGCGHLTVAGNARVRHEHRTAARERAECAEARFAACTLALSLVVRQMANNAGVLVAWACLFYGYGWYEDPQRRMPDAMRRFLAVAASLPTSSAPR